MVSEVVDLEKLLDNEGRLFDIPKLQRGFVWDAENAAQLINSINTHIELDLDLFLGVVIIFDDQAPGSKLQVIDGQQRITTLAMICKLILDQQERFFKSLDKWTAVELEEECKNEGLPHSGTKQVKYNRLFEKSRWSRLKKFIFEGEDLRITHNTDPDNMNFKMVMNKNKEFYSKKTKEIEAKKVFDEKQQDLEEAAGEKKRVNDDVASTDEEKERALNNWRGKRDERDEAKEDYNTAKENSKVPWRKRLGKIPAMRYCYEELSHWNRKSLENDEELMRFIDFIIERVRIVKITIFEDTQRHKVFKSLNAFGKGLTASEKIKNDLLSFATDVGTQGPIEGLWGNLETKLGEVAVDTKTDVVTEFLWNYCKAHGITLPQSSSNRGETSSTLKFENTYAVFDCEGGLFEKEVKSDTGVDSTKLSDFLNKLINWAEGYKKIQNPRLLRDKGVDREWVNEIVGIRNLMPSQTRPYLLAAYMKTLGKTGGSKTNFQRLVKCVSVTLARIICAKGVSVNKLEAAMQKLTTMVHDNTIENAIERVEHEVMELIQKYYDIDVDDSFGRDWKRRADELFEGELKGKGKDFPKSNAKFILCGCEGIDHWQKNTRELIVDYHETKFYSAEHILPYNGLRPFSAGKGDWFREHELHESFDDNDPDISAADKYRQCRGMIGNFLILEIKVNQHCGTKTWAGKDVILSRSPVVRGKIERAITLHGRREADRQRTGNWGKFHVIAHAKWAYSLAGAAEEEHQGSHLLSVRRFCNKYANNEYWGAEHIIERSNKIAREAKKNNNWRFWNSGAY